MFHYLVDCIQITKIKFEDYYMTFNYTACIDIVLCVMPAVLNCGFYHWLKLLKSNKEAVGQAAQTSVVSRLILNTWATC